MNAEIIAVGSEMLTPERLDTNSLFITAELNALGVEVTHKCVVGDDLERLTSCLRAALERAAIVVVSGGLGPTEDDLTRDAVARALGRELVFSEEILAQIEARFARLRRRMAEINRRQAFLVAGAEALSNPNGTAPGQWIEAEGNIVLLLPGPPGELQPMMTNHCVPRLQAKLPPQHIRTLCLRVAGMPESDLDQLISPVYKQYTNPVTTVLAGLGDIQVHLRARTETAAEAEALVAELGAKIETVLGNRIYSRDGEPLESTVGALLRARGATLAVAESCTGGMLAARVTDVPGSSAYFLGGFLVYGVSMKTALLGLDPALVARHGVVSEEVAKAMADGARDRTGATFALSVTGEAGPDSATPGVPAGTVWIGMASREQVTARLFRFGGGRARVRGFAVQTALEMLRRTLAGLA